MPRTDSLQGYDTVMDTLDKQTLSAVTYHDYPQCLPAQAQGVVLQPSCLSKLDATAAEAAKIVAPYGAEVWDGEGADHTATGADFGHDFLPTFQSSFYYSWLQGALPLNGVSLAVPSNT